MLLLQIHEPKYKHTASIMFKSVEKLEMKCCKSYIYHIRVGVDGEGCRHEGSPVATCITADLRRPLSENTKLSIMKKMPRVVRNILHLMKNPPDDPEQTLEPPRTVVQENVSKSVYNFFVDSLSTIN